MFAAVVESCVLESNESPLVSWKEKVSGFDEILLIMASLLIGGDYEEVLKLPVVSQLLLQIPNRNKIFDTDDDPFEEITQLFEEFLINEKEANPSSPQSNPSSPQSSPSSPQQRQLLVLFIGIACLRIFLQSNWTGPSLKIAPIFENFTGILENLEVDGEPCYKYISNPQYLATASSILINLTEFLSSLCSRTLWAARCAFTHQKVLLGPSEKLRKIAEKGYEKGQFAYTLESNSTIAAMSSLEMGLLFHYYRDSSRARTYFLKCQEQTGLKTTLTGALGRRTKFQTFDLPQLVLLAKSQDPEKSEECQVPENVPNPDPDAPMLESTKFRETLPGVDANLDVLDQCIILALCLDVKNQNPRHGLTWEEMRVYVDRVLKNPNNWMVHSMALLQRARLEFERTKTIDKACLQIQVLVDQFDSSLEDNYKPAVRMKYLDLLAYPHQVSMKKELGQKWLKLGSAASAQALFQQLEMWEEIVDCFLIRDMANEAEKLVRERLEIDPTPRLWAALGDITSNRTYYEKSWELSKGRYTRAKRCLGKIAMKDKMWEEAIQHLKEALKINPQYGEAWFSMGCCALKIDDYATAQQAFARVVQLYPDDGESWNNLASVHLKHGKKKEAFKALKEAIRFKGESWQIWENLLIVSLDLGEFSQSILALDRILELKENYIDIPALSFLVKFVVEEVKSGKTELGILHKQLDQLLQKITTKTADNAALWDVYAQYWMGLSNPEEAVKQRHKQCRALQVSGWEDTMPLFSKLVEACQKLTDDQISHNGPKQLYSTRLYLNSILKKSQESFRDTPEHEKLKVMIQKIQEQEATHKK